MRKILHTLIWLLMSFGTASAYLLSGGVSCVTAPTGLSGYFAAITNTPISPGICTSAGDCHSWTAPDGRTIEEVVEPPFGTPGTTTANMANCRTSPASARATFALSAAGTLMMTVSGTGGAWSKGQVLAGSGLPSGKFALYVWGQATGTPGGDGTYYINYNSIAANQPVIGTAITVSALPDAAPCLDAAIAAVRTAGVNKLLIPAGTYALTSYDSYGHWTIANLNDVTIDGQGSTFWITNNNYNSSQNFGVFAYANNRVRMQNMTFGYSLHTASIGTMQSVSGTVTARIDDGTGTGVAGNVLTITAVGKPTGTAANLVAAINSPITAGAAGTPKITAIGTGAGLTGTYLISGAAQYVPAGTAMTLGTAYVLVAQPQYAPISSTCTGSITGETLTLPTACLNVVLGAAVTCLTCQPGTYVTAIGPSAGASTTYTVNAGQTAASQQMTITADPIGHLAAWNLSTATGSAASGVLTVGTPATTNGFCPGTSFSYAGLATPIVIGPQLTGATKCGAGTYRLQPGTASFSAQTITETPTWFAGQTTLYWSPGMSTTPTMLAHGVYTSSTFGSAYNGVSYIIFHYGYGATIYETKDTNGLPSTDLSFRNISTLSGPGEGWVFEAVARGVEFSGSSWAPVPGTLVSTTNDATASLIDRGDFSFHNDSFTGVGDDVMSFFNAPWSMTCYAGGPVVAGCSSLLAANQATFQAYANHARTGDMITWVTPANVYVGTSTVVSVSGYTVTFDSLPSGLASGDFARDANMSNQRVYVANNSVIATQGHINVNDGNALVQNNFVQGTYNMGIALWAGFGEFLQGAGLVNDLVQDNVLVNTGPMGGSQSLAGLPGGAIAVFGINPSFTVGNTLWGRNVSILNNTVYLSPVGCVSVADIANVVIQGNLCDQVNTGTSNLGAAAANVQYPIFTTYSSNVQIAGNPLTGSTTAATIYAGAGDAGVTVGGQYYVAAGVGNDANSGTAAQPFATIAHCQAMMEANAVPICYIQDGTTYAQTATVALTAADSGFAFVAAPGSYPVLDGGGTLASLFTNTGGHNISLAGLSMQNTAPGGPGVVYASGDTASQIVGNTFVNPAIGIGLSGSMGDVIFDDVWTGAGSCVASTSASGTVQTGNACNGLPD
jgi:hypothetical protein